MGRCNNALKMLFILRFRVATRKELADILEVSERQITRYKNDLENAGFIILSNFGCCGGYKLVKNF